MVKFEWDAFENGIRSTAMLRALPCQARGDCRTLLTCVGRTEGVTELDMSSDHRPDCKAYHRPLASCLRADIPKEWTSSEFLASSPMDPAKWTMGAVFRPPEPKT